MNYITACVNERNGIYYLTEFYSPIISIGQINYLRIITGNINVKSIKVSFENTSLSAKIPMIETVKTVFETKINPEFLDSISLDDITNFKIHLFIELRNGEIKEIISKDIIKILGSSLGIKNKNDLSYIYERLNDLSDRIYNNKHS